MKRLQKSLLFSLAVATIFALTPFIVKAYSENSTPLILNIKQVGAEYLNRPLVTGLTPENSEVLIYVDGTFVGMANINREQTGTDNFYYQLSGPLPEGTHTISVLAKDPTSLILSSFSNVVMFSVDSLPAPTLIQPNESTVTGNVKPMISGLSVNNTLVHIFIDGQHNGKTDILSHLSGTANFAYKPFLNLAPGWHTIWARSEDASGRVSKSSNVLHFRIENPLPAPIVINTVVNNNSTVEQPLITGIVKNNTKVRVFIDKKLNGEFLTMNNPNGVSNFSYKPFLKLSTGRHIIYATAIDARGKESIWSNIIYYTVLPNEPAISEEAASEDKSETNKNADESIRAEEKSDTGKEVGDLKDSELNNNKDSKGVDQEIKDILEASKASTTEENGFINESKEQQGQLRLNLVIFILFLFAVIAWIFWVNRELIKEKREQNDKDEE